MFSRIMKYAIPQTVAGIFFGILLVSVSFHARAVNELVGDATPPLGSHSDVHAQFANARHLWQTGKLKQAAALYESLIARSPNLPDPYNNLAVIYAAQGDYKKAQQILEKGLNTHAGYAAIYENLTAIYVEMARDSYGKALQFADKPGHQLKLRSLAELSLKPVQVAQVKTSVREKITTTPPAPVNVVAVPTPIEKAPVLSATASVKPLPAAIAVPTSPVIDETEINEVLMSWAAAWSAQSAEQYLTFYDQNYHPPGLSRRKWQARRIERIKRPQWIRVSLSKVVVKPLADKRVRVEAQQRYQSNTYSDSSRKAFILIQTEQGWRIVSERNL